MGSHPSSAAAALFFKRQILVACQPLPDELPRRVAPAHFIGVILNGACTLAGDKPKSEGRQGHNSRERCFPQRRFIPGISISLNRGCDWDAQCLPHKHTHTRECIYTLPSADPSTCIMQSSHVFPNSFPSVTLCAYPPLPTPSPSPTILRVSISCVWSLWGRRASLVISGVQLRIPCCLS